MPPPYFTTAEPTGAESRALRCALHLDRRQLATVAAALGVGGPGVTAERVGQWERSRGRGYPPDLLAALAALDAGADALAGVVGGEAAAGVLRRPVGARRIVALMDLPAAGLRLAPEAFAVLDAEGGAIWQAICDAAVTRALFAARAAGRAVRLDLDRAPDGA